MIFHHIRPSISGNFPILLGRIVPPDLIQVLMRPHSKGSLPGVNAQQQVVAQNPVYGLLNLRLDLLAECSWLSCLEMGDKRSVIAFSLIRIEFSKRSNCLIEHISAAQVAANHGGIA